MNQNLRVNKTYFHMKGFALGLALKQKRKATRKSPIEILHCNLKKSLGDPKFLRNIKNEQCQKRRMAVFENNTKREGLEGETVHFKVVSLLLLLFIIPVQARKYPCAGVCLLSQSGFHHHRHTLYFITESHHQ